MAEPAELTAARLELARLSRRNHRAAPSEVDEARAAYVTAKLDNAIRRAVAETLRGVRLDDVQVAHLCGLLLMETGVSGPDVQLIEHHVRAAVLRAQRGDER